MSEKEFVDYDLTCLDTGKASIYLDSNSKDCRTLNLQHGAIRLPGKDGSRSYHVKVFYVVQDVLTGKDTCKVGTANFCGGLNDNNGDEVGWVRFDSGEWCLEVDASSTQVFSPNTVIYWEYFVDTKKVLKEDRDSSVGVYLNEDTHVENNKDDDVVVACKHCGQLADHSGMVYNPVTGKCSWF